MEPPRGRRLPFRTDDAIRRDARTWQLMAVQRTEREGERLVHELEGRRSEFVRHQRDTVKQLEAAGYLRHSEPRTRFE